MAITTSFLYNKAKEMMMGKSLTAGEALSMNFSLSMAVAFILESHTPDPQASTTGSYRSVFASRIANAASASQLADVALSANEITSSGAITFFDAADIASASISTGQIIGGLLIYRKMTDDGDSFPIALIDINVVTANGATINVNWDNGVNRIFALSG